MENEIIFGIFAEKEPYNMTMWFVVHLIVTDTCNEFQYAILTVDTGITLLAATSADESKRSTYFRLSITWLLVTCIAMQRIKLPIAMILT